MNSSPDLTIVIPCHRNDERFIYALKSAQWASEVLVIDQNAQVDWSELQKLYRFEVMKYPVLQSFSAMKNEAMIQVKTTWIFSLDSDEYITKDLAEEIQKQIESTEVDGLSLRRVDVFLNKKIFHGETRDANFLRIVKKGEAEWQGSVHETLVVKNKEAKVHQLKHPLYHQAHHSIHEFIQKVNSYTSHLSYSQSEGNLILKSVIWPVGKFLYSFVVKKGFLDGYRGLVYSFMMSIHSNAVRVKRYEQK